MHTSFSRRAALALPLLATPLRATTLRAGAVPTIAAAADLRLALDKVIAGFRADTGMVVRATYGSSGNLARQIEQGAPFAMLMSADEAYVNRLVTAGLTDGPAQLYAIGRLALVAPRGGLRVDARLAGLRAALAAGAVQRFAIANPDHAPYGQRAREALVSQRLWPQLQSRLVLGENVAQALQFVTVGGADAGIVSLALLYDNRVRAALASALLPAAWHSPLRQSLALIRNAGPVARAFRTYLGQPQARKILARHGFAVPR